MMVASKVFERRVLDELLPAFCGRYNLTSEGFRPDWGKVSQVDARDCLAAIDNAIVIHLGGGAYRAPRSRANEYLFWGGARAVTPRPISLWLEPIITFAVLWRLHRDFGWPIALIGAQSADWAFDVTVFITEHSIEEYVACEVKKTPQEVDALINESHRLCADPELKPKSATERNAWKKVAALRARRVPVFWVVGPNQMNLVYAVEHDEGGRLSLLPILRRVPFLCKRAGHLQAVPFGARMSKAIPKATEETGVAFRAGVQGLPYSHQPGPRRELQVAPDVAPGPIEKHYEMAERLPGLSDPVAAYETGRALRMIGFILDDQGSPQEHGPAFLSRLAEAILYFAMRAERQPWGAEDTAFVFLEMSAAAAPREVREHTRKAIVDYARKRPIPASRAP